MPQLPSASTTTAAMIRGMRRRRAGGSSGVSGESRVSSAIVVKPSFDLVDHPKGSIGADPSRSVVDPGLDHGVLCQNHRALSIGGLHAACNTGAEPLLSLGKL